MEGGLLILVHGFHGAMFSQVGPWSHDVNRTPTFQPLDQPNIFFAPERLVEGKIYRKPWENPSNCQGFQKIFPLKSMEMITGNVPQRQNQ